MTNGNSTAVSFATEPTQGWQCPCCKAIFSPSMNGCAFCNPFAQASAASGANFYAHRCSVAAKATYSIIPCPGCGKSPCDRSTTGCGSSPSNYGVDYP